MKKANFYTHQKNDKVRCLLCPRECLINVDQHGFCFIRKNIKGDLYNLVYSLPAAVHVDPVEKKPLYHFLPGSKTFSLGTIGCNLLCKNCQNWSLARGKLSGKESLILKPIEVVQSAIEYECKSIAYTYNEPTIFAEYIMDTAEIARKHGLKNIMVTNGYITSGAIARVYENIDAANIDLKAYDEQFYRKITAGHLNPVLNTIKTLHTMNIRIELTYLLIPKLNDDISQIRDMISWTASF